MEVQKVQIEVGGLAIDFELARRLAAALAEKDDPEILLISWFDQKQDRFSPSGCQCEIKGEPGWEVYGRSHGGRLRIEVNGGEYVFWYS